MNDKEIQLTTPHQGVKRLTSKKLYGIRNQ